MPDIELLIKNFSTTYALIGHYVSDFRFMSFKRLPFSCRLALAEAYYCDCLDERVFDIYDAETVKDVKEIFAEIIQINRIHAPRFKESVARFIDDNLHVFFQEFFDYITDSDAGHQLDPDSKKPTLLVAKQVLAYKNHLNYEEQVTKGMIRE
jgi:hypothetical protein